MKEKLSKRKNKFLKWIRGILFFYVLAGVILYYMQEKILFHPVALPADYVFNFDVPFEERTINYDGATSFNIVRFKVGNDSLTKGAVIYFHGNMDNINRYAKFANNFIKHGYEVWMMDYPEFGKSTGELNEKMLYIEALEVYRMVRAAGYAADDIIIYGKSIGTGIASQLASLRDCKRLILETPYYSIENLAAFYYWMYPVDWMVRFKLPTYIYLQKVSAPVTVFHGTDDGVIPLSNAEKLKALFKRGDELIIIERGIHNNLNDFALMKNKLDSLLKL